MLSPLDIKIAELLPLFYKLTDCRMQIAKLALDSIADPPHYSFQQVFEHGVSLNRHYFDRLKSTFPKNDALWKTTVPKRVLELVAASRSPLTTAELNFVVHSLLLSASDDDIAAALLRLRSFFAHQAPSAQPIVTFQHKTVADWIKTSDPECVSLYPGYQLDHSLREAYKGLAALLLLYIFRQYNPRKPADQFRRDVADQLLLLTQSEVPRFLRLTLPPGDVGIQTLDLMLFYLGEATQDDAKTRSTLLTTSGTLTAIRSLGQDSRNASGSILRKGIELDCAELVRCAITDLGASVSARLPPDSVDLPLTLAASLAKEGIVKLLISMQADCAAPNSSKLTAVHCALKKKPLNPAVLQVLLAHVLCQCKRCKTQLKTVWCLC